MSQTLTPSGQAGGIGGPGGFPLRINPFVSLFAASLITFLPTHAIAQQTQQPTQSMPAQTSPSAPGQPAQPAPTPAQEADELVRDAPVGVRDRERPEYDTGGRHLGSFVLNATLDLAVTSTDNLFAADESQEFDDIIYQISPNARLESDWSRHMVALEAGAGWRMHDDFSNEDTDTHYVRALGRLDIGRSTSLRGALRSAHQVTPRTDPDSPTIGEPVEYDRTDATAGFEHRFARLLVSADATHSEYDYEGAQSDRDNEHDFIRGRAAWEISPRLSVVGTVTADERDYENRPQANSEAMTYLAGINITGDLMSGEITVGQFERDYDDPAIGTLDGLAVAAEVEWYVTQLTTLTFRARRDADDQISADLRLPFVSQEYGAQIDHELRRNVILTASANVGERDYDPLTRRDDYTELEVGADWLLNRRAAVRFRYERDEVESDGVPASRDYEVNAVTLGLTLRL